MGEVKTAYEKETNEILRKERIREGTISFLMTGRSVKEETYEDEVKEGRG